MNFGEGSLPLILLAIGLILMQFFLRRRRQPEVTQQEIVERLLAEVRLNLSLVEVFYLDSKIRKFETAAWQMNKTKLDFLEHPVQGALADAFRMAEDFNQQIAAAKKHKSASYMINIDANKLKGPLTKSRLGLEEWLLTKIGTKEPRPKYPGIFDDFVGKQ